MNTTAKVLLFTFCAIAVVCIGGFLFFFKAFTVPTSGMEPGVVRGSYHFVCKIPSRITRNDIIVFAVAPGTGLNDEEEWWVMRLIGMPGDKLEIKQTEVLINDAPYPFKIPLAFRYEIFTNQNINPLVLEKMGLYPEDLLPTASTSLMINLTAEQLEKLRELPVVDSVRKMASSHSTIGPNIEETWNHPGWDEDDFGPVIVPEDTYFVMGDNRDNILDSRYIGVIPKANVFGFLLITLNEDVIH